MPWTPPFAGEQTELIDTGWSGLEVGVPFLELADSLGGDSTAAGKSDVRLPRAVARIEPKIEE